VGRRESAGPWSNQEGLKQEAKMRTIAKAGLGALALASLGAIATAPANAQSFGFSFGTGPVYGGYYNGYSDSPCYRPYPYRPYYCDRRYIAPAYGYGYGYAPRAYYGGYYGGRYGYPPYRYRDRDRERRRY
jgi:hypothetical protein